MAELMTEDAETAGGIAEAPSRFGGRELLDEVGAEGFVLAMKRLLGERKKAAAWDSVSTDSELEAILIHCYRTQLSQYVSSDEW